MRTRFAQLAAAAIAAVTVPFTTTVPLAAAAVEPAKPGSAPADATIKSFLGTYCTECHGPEKQKGDRRWDQLSLPVRNADTLLDLQDIIDQLNLGEMPPKKAKQPGGSERRKAIALLTETVTGARDKFASTGGQTVLRRLNRREYINTVGDLFALNMTMFDPTVKFPGDQTVMHLDNIGDALRTSGYLLDQYLDAAEQVVEKAFRLQKRPPEQSWTFNGDFRQDQPVINRYGSVDRRYLRLYAGPNTAIHIGAYAPILEFAEGVPADGFYEIKVRAAAMDRLQPYDPTIASVLEPGEPFRLAIVPGDHKAGHLHEPQLIEPVLAETTLGDNGPESHTFKVWLDAGYTPRFIWPNGTMTEDIRKISKGNRRQRGERKLPHIQIHEVQIRGPLYDQWPPVGQQVIFGGQTFDAGRTRAILEAFASRAFRRPARAEEVDRLMALVAQRGKDGRSPLEALEDGLKAVLCSPAFLYLVEPEPVGELIATKSRALPAHALASRLSYFLWSTMPDAELTVLAQSGDLLKPEVLVAQTKRLLASPKSAAFVAGFLDSWLNLRSLGDMPPDRDAFERYYAQNLQPAMKRETQLFARHLLDHNESIVRFLDADYTFVNRPLAKLYGLADTVSTADGHLFRQVKLTNPNRGGLLGQGSVLTVSANGVETSPVTRGVWLLENILGTPPAPPPDDVPAIEPDVRAAKTMREILARHRSDPACYECHQKIDPLGFALESFDPIGAWRGHYEKVERINRLQVNRIVGAPIDASGELPGGQSFKDVAGLKKVLVERKDQFARTLTERLLSYACGRWIERLDRPEVDRIVRELAGRGYGFKDLIELVALSKAFQSK